MILLDTVLAFVDFALVYKISPTNSRISPIAYSLHILKTLEKGLLLSVYGVYRRRSLDLLAT